MIMKKKILLALSFIILATSISFGQGFTKPSEGKSVIYIVNIMLGLSQTKIFNEEGCIGFLKSRDYLRYECEPGEHVILGLTGVNRDFFTADLKAGEIYIMQMRTVEKLGGSAPLFKAIDDLSSSGKRNGIIKIVNKPANVAGDEEIAKTNKKWLKTAKKGFDKYETKLKQKKKYAHLSKEMFYAK